MKGLASRLHISREQLLQIHRYCEPDDAKSLFWLFLDAFIFGASYRIVALHFTLTLPMIIVAGSRVKALSNLFHDASHGNLFASSLLNETIAQFLLAPFLFEKLNLYRHMHRLHHAYVNDNEDPDLLPLEVSNLSPANMFKRLLLSPAQISSSVFGSLLKRFQMSDFVAYLIFWGIFFVICSKIEDSQYGLLYILGFYLLSRLLCFHPSRVFVMISDHAYLPRRANDISGISRNVFSTSIAMQIFHPHNDGYHLLHHLFPAIPMARLKSAHMFLMCSSEPYRSCENLHSYFLSSRSLAQAMSSNYSVISASL